MCVSDREGLLRSAYLSSCKSTTDQVHLDLTTDTVSGTKVDVISLTYCNFFKSATAWSPICHELS